MQSIYVDLAESWNDGGSSKSDTTSNIPHYSTSSIFEVPLDVQHDRSDDAGNTRVRFDNEYIPVPSANSSTSDDTMGDHPGLIQASLEHSKLLSFINACLPLDTGLDQFQHVSPFIKVGTDDVGPALYEAYNRSFSRLGVRESITTAILPILRASELVFRYVEMSDHYFVAYRASRYHTLPSHGYEISRAIDSQRLMSTRTEVPGPSMARPGRHECKIHVPQL